MKREVIFARNGWRYTAYLNALFELPARRSLYIPGALELERKRFLVKELPGGVLMAVKHPDSRQARSGRIHKMISLIIRQDWRFVKCGRMTR